MYSLRYEGAAEAVWDSLPDDARQEFDRAILAACEDPYGATEPHPEDGDVKRLLVLEHTSTALVVFKDPVRRLRILEITYLG